MIDSPIKTTVLTDFVGSYVAYTYADGHVETDPPGRPTSKEDVQRLRKRQAATDNTKSFLAAEQAKNGAGLSVDLVRDGATAAIGRLLDKEYHETVDATSTMLQTVVADSQFRQQVIDNADLGGDIVGDKAGERPEYGGRDA
jgi:hypothetical protein